MTCSLCKPDPKYLIAEGSKSYATLFQAAVKPGHTVVAMKEHKPLFHNISDQEAKEIFALANRVSKALVELTHANKIYLISICDVDEHFHIHLLPKCATEQRLGPFVFGEHGWAASVKQKCEGEAMATFVEQIKRALSS